MLSRGVFVASLAMSGCSTQLAPLIDEPVAVSVPEAAGPPVSLLVCRFADLRGDVHSRINPVSLIPGPNFVYTGQTFHYVERVGFPGSKNGRPLIRQGDLQNALPDMIAAAVLQARPHWTVEVTASRDRCRSGGDAALVIDGAVRRTDLRTHFNVVPLGLLALLGVPYVFVAFDGELDVEVRHADSGAIAWRHGFEIDERRSVGAYYNHRAASEMFSALVRETVAQSVTSAIHIAERGTSPDGAH